MFFDASVYIDAFRNADRSILGRRSSDESGEIHRPLWLSAVVLEELYVGASDGKVKKLLNKFEREFENLDRLLVPNQHDWSTCGQVLAMIGRKYGFEHVRKTRMTNDCLMAMTAARKGLTIVTVNAKDFKLIAEFRAFQWETS